MAWSIIRFSGPTRGRQTFLNQFFQNCARISYLQSEMFVAKLGEFVDICLNYFVISTRQFRVKPKYVRCHWHRGVKISGVNQTTEPDSFGVNTTSEKPGGVITPRSQNLKVWNILISFKGTITPTMSEIYYLRDRVRVFYPWFFSGIEPT